MPDPLTDAAWALGVIGRLAARLDEQRCRGATGDYVYHCAECCFGTGFEATTQAELDDVLLMRDATGQLAHLHRVAARLGMYDAADWLWKAMPGDALDV